jgi:hypothetical protein
MNIERRALWENSQDNWNIPNLDFTGNNIKEKRGGAVNTALFNDLEETSLDEDFEAAATDRVN